MFKKMILAALVFAATHATQGYSYCAPYCDYLGGYADRAWASADYLYWKIKDSPESVPLVQQEGDDGSFSTVLGGKKIDAGWRSGGRFALGYWFDCQHCLGIEGSYFFLARKAATSSIYSDANGSPALVVPYFNVTTDLEDSSPLATPGLYRGSARLHLSNKMQGAEVNMLAMLPRCNPFCDIALLAGFRYWNFKENLKFAANSPIISPPSVYNYYDTFDVTNNFYGAQIGASIDYRHCALSINLKGKLALGGLCQQAAIHGAFETNEFTGETETFAGGFFALPTNMGHHKNSCFSVIPEVDLNIGYDITDCLRLQLGYSFLYVSSVYYSGNQMDSKINPTQSANIDFTETPVLVGEARPKVTRKREGLWAQGLNAGFVFAF